MACFSASEQVLWLVYWNTSYLTCAWDQRIYMASRYVLLGDVVQSRNIDDREAFRDHLAEVCATLNDDYDPSIHAEFSVLKGVDEVGGVLSSLAGAYDIVRDLFEALRPYELRLAIASGEIDVGADSPDVSEMDGPAFHRAAELLDGLEDSGLLFDMDAEKGTLDTALADEINLLLLIRRGWTDRQQEIIQAYLRHGGQDGAARELGVTQQAISDALTKASWPTVDAIEERLVSTLGGYDQ